MIVGIAGGSGSGKTQLARLLSRRLKAELISADLFFKDPLTFPITCGHPDYDRLEAVDWDRLEEAIRLSKAADVVVEGFLIFARPEIRRLLEMKVFIDLAEDELIARRLRRDSEIPGDYIEKIVRERHRALVLPTRRLADLILDGSKARGELLLQVLTYYGGLRGLS